MLMIRIPTATSYMINSFLQEDLNSIFDWSKSDDLFYIIINLAKTE